MEAYMKALRSLPKVIAEEEEGLWRRHWAGDPDARGRLIERHLGLVVKIARRYPENGLGREDLAQEGVFGLSRAVDLWKTELGFSFATYAWTRIRAAILYAIRRKGALIRTPTYATIEDRAAERVLDPIPVVSLSTPLHAGEDGGCIEDLLSDQKIPGLDDLAEEKDAGDVLDEALRTLPAKQETVLRRHYGIGTHERSLEEIGAELGCSRQYIHQVEKVALGRLRKKKQLRALAGCR
jgi:RNA polymerase sigma factor (sigma-70 family)